MTAGVGTLVASASIARADGSPSRNRGSAFEHLSIGQHLKLQVLRQLEQHRYEVTFGGRRHVVESRVPLDAGSQIDAQVEAKGDQLELRYLGIGVRASPPELPMAAAATPAGDSAPAAAWIQSLAEQFRVPLDAKAQQVIARSAAQASDPELMTRGGLFLQKLAQRVNAADLEALYRALSGAERTPIAAMQSPLDLTDLTDNDDVADSLADALDSAMPAPADTHVEGVGEDADAGEGGEDDGQRALRLLNLQDDGAVAWHYGTLPLLVGGRLVELDLVMFREREQRAARGGLKRLVMTLDTTHFGRVHVEARAVDSRLMVTLSAANPEAVEILAGYGKDVRNAIEQLGWAVDDVRYELKAANSGPAQEIVRHVLSAGTVDREL